MSTARFDQAAEAWDSKPTRVKVALTIATAITSTLPLKQTMTALEYGCGTGLVTCEVAKKVGTIYGLDSSAGMIAVLNKKIDQPDISNIKLYHGDLSVLEDRQFELIICSMTLHHIKNYHQLLRQFSELLRPGGFLALADLASEDGTFHDDNEGIGHFGFDPADLRQQLTELGLVSSKEQTIFTVEKNNQAYPIFLLTAQQPN